MYAVNKPAGVVSTASDTHGRPTVVSLVPSPLRLYPVGRLDIDTTGLILLTNDGELAHRLTHPSFEVMRTYRAVLARPPVREAALRALRRGVELDDGLTAPARVTRIAPDTIELTIHEGRKRQVKRMCEHVGHRVLSLERVRFGPVPLGELPPGAHRRLSETEISLLRSAGSGARRAGASSSRSACETAWRGQQDRVRGDQAHDREAVHVAHPQLVEPGDRVAALHLRRDQVARRPPPAQRLLGRADRDHVELGDALGGAAEEMQVRHVQRQRQQRPVVLDQDRAAVEA